jgi:hypothetical protein
MTLIEQLKMQEIYSRQVSDEAAEPVEEKKPAPKRGRPAGKK